MADLNTDGVRERFYRAARALATMSESRWKRVEAAAEILQPFQVRDSDLLPEAFRERFEQLRQLYQKKITPGNAGKLAEQIFDFYIELRGGL